MHVLRGSAGTFEINVTADDRCRLHNVLNTLAPLASLEALGRHEQFTDAAWWQLLVGQVAVMGGSNGWSKAMKDPAFLSKLALDRCLAARDASKHLAKTLSEHSATRFWRKAADKLAGVLRDKRIVRNGHVVLCEGLDHTMPPNMIRQALVSRCELFKLKSASDFMIGAGLSHDVIAFDARVGGLLREEFGLDVTTARIQGNETLYLALESTLREISKEVGKPLALLDRVIFQFRGTDPMKAALE